MKLGDVDTPRTRKRVDDAADREEVKYYKKHRRTALQESTDRRLIMMGSASGACTVITISILSWIVYGLGLGKVEATTTSLALAGGVGIGLMFGGLFAVRLVPKAQQQGLLDDEDGLTAWEEASGPDADKRWHL